MTDSLLWNYGELGAKISAMIAAAGTAANLVFGGWDRMIQALLAAMAIDFLLGILSAVKSGTVNSHTMFWGGVNKILVLVFVAFGVVLDGALGLSEPYIRTVVIWFYLGREGLSIVENYGKMGLPLPSVVVGILEQLKEKGDKGGTEE